MEYVVKKTGFVALSHSHVERRREGDRVNIADQSHADYLKARGVIGDVEEETKAVTDTPEKKAKPAAQKKAAKAED